MVNAIFRARLVSMAILEGGYEESCARHGATTRSDCYVTARVHSLPSSRGRLEASTVPLRVLYGE